MKRFVQFGAGNIGRSFIGQTFSRSGYEVVFVDIVEAIVKAMNEKHEYRVVIKKNEGDDEIISVKNVRAVNGKDQAAVASEIAESDYIATSVGKNALTFILPVIAKGLLKRRELHGDKPLDIIIAENIHDGAAFMKAELKKSLPASYPIDSLVGLVETSIGKMVPIMKAEDVAKDPLWVFAESYNSLILDKRGFKNGLPENSFIQPVENIKAYVDRKLFIHNLGHASAAYFGFAHDPSLGFIWQTLESPKVAASVRKAMDQSAAALAKEYPDDLSSSDLADHIADLLYRFRNKALGDTVFRVGKDLYRKLAKDDRLVGAMLLCVRHGLPCDGIADAVIAGMKFRAADEAGNLFKPDADFAAKEYAAGFESVLSSVCRLDPKNAAEAAAMEELRKAFSRKG